MEIVIGSHNRTKIAAVQSVFKKDIIIPINARSSVSDQPIGDEETREGAINRAHHARTNHPESLGIGLEGGVMNVSGKLFLCNWGALEASDGLVFTASGARIALPHSFSEPIENGLELSELMDDFTKRKNIRSHEGAIGIFTNHLIDRKSMFIHVVTLLKGQYEYARKKVLE